MHQIRNREVNDEQLLITVIALVWKYQFLVDFNKTVVRFMFDIITLLYISLPSWPNINTLCTEVER